MSSPSAPKPKLDPEDYKQLAKEAYDQRKLVHEWPQAKLAAEAGCSKALIVLIEGATSRFDRIKENPPSVNQIVRLAHVLGADPKAWLRLAGYPDDQRAARVIEPIIKSLEGEQTLKRAQDRLREPEDAHAKAVKLIRQACEPVDTPVFLCVNYTSPPATLEDAKRISEYAELLWTRNLWYVLCVPFPEIDVPPPPDDIEEPGYERKLEETFELYQYYKGVHANVRTFAKDYRDLLESWEGSIVEGSRRHYDDSICPVVPWERICVVSMKWRDHDGSSEPAGLLATPPPPPMMVDARPFLLYKCDPLRHPRRVADNDAYQIGEWRTYPNSSRLPEFDEKEDKIGTHLGRFRAFFYDLIAAWDRAQFDENNLRTPESGWGTLGKSSYWETPRYWWYRTKYKTAST